MHALTTSPAIAAAPLVTARQPDPADRVLAKLTLAFAADPPCRWLYPDPEQYLDFFPAFARAFGGAALEHGTAIESAGGAALWLPPGAGPDEEALIALVEHSTQDDVRDEAFALFAEMGRVHPSEPHWYLPLVGVEPAWQGQGQGSALIRPVLAQCDATGLPAYLEATSEGSRRLYERLGFETIGLVEVGTCPPIVPMLRRPR